jgi:hypothetical protein
MSASIIIRLPLTNHINTRRAILAQLHWRELTPEGGGGFGGTGELGEKKRDALPVACLGTPFAYL